MIRRALAIPIAALLALAATGLPRAAAQEAPVERESAPESPLAPALEPLASRLQGLEEEAQAIESRAASVDALSSDIRTRAERLTALDADVRARAAQATGGLQIGAALRRAKADLPSIADLRAGARSASREASRLDDRLFEAQESKGRVPLAPDRLREFLRDDLAIVDPDAQTLAQASALALRIDAATSTLIASLEGSDGLIQRLQELSTARGALAAQAEATAAFINERVLWVRSDPPFRAPQVRATARAVLDLADPARWAPVVSALVTAGWLATSGPVVLAMLALAAARLWAGRRLRLVLLRAATPGHESAWHAAEALCLAALRAAFVPGLMLASARIVSGLAADGAGRLAPAIAAGLAHAAGAVFAAAALRSLCERDGVGERFFHWRPDATAAARSHLAWFAPLLGVTLGLLGFTASLADDAETRVVPRVCFIAACLAVAVFVAIALRPSGAIFRPPALAKRQGRKALALVHAVGALAFVALAAMTALGWFFSAEALALRIRDTALVVGAVLLVRALALRWIGLSIDRAASRQAAHAESKAEAPGVPPLIEERPPADLRLVRKQVGTLATILAALVCVAALGPVWNDVIPALNRLDSVGLIPFGAVDAAALREKGTYVLTLRDALKTAIILGVGLAALRTLPGMLDGLVLSRTRLDSGARFAAETIAKYAILGITVFLVLGALRTKWGSVGWVLGGLSVGIGFGLQEFFGNLVAGLSLLFERTIRPGDRVQVGEHVGVVKEITIRATTLADFRRRDVIVPNRMLLSGIVLNETRSDRTSVASFVVGVAHGSNTELVQRLLLEACQGHPEVLEVTVNFEAFGANSLEFKVSATVVEIDRRAEVVNDLHLAIDRLFRDHRVEISFPQRDLHIRGGEVAVRLAPTPPGAVPGAPPGAPAGRG